MTFQFGQDLEMDQLRTNHNISKILTTPFGKKEGCDGDKSNNKGGSVGNPFNSFKEAQFSPQSFCRTSLILRQARPQNIKICAAGFENHSPAFDACLSQTQLNSKGGVNGSNQC